MDKFIHQTLMTAGEVLEVLGAVFGGILGVALTFVLILGWFASGAYALYSLTWNPCAGLLAVSLWGILTNGIWGYYLAHQPDHREDDEDTYDGRDDYPL